MIYPSGRDAALAMVKKGLDAPMGQKENQLYSYAARQIAENDKGERYMVKPTPEDQWLLTPGEYRFVSEDISAWKRGKKHFQSRANGGIIISSGNNLIVFVDKKGNIEHVLEVDVEDQDLNNAIFDQMLRYEQEGGDTYGAQQEFIESLYNAGNTHFRVPGEGAKAQRNNGRRTYRITESNRQGDRGGISSAEGDTDGEHYDLKRDADQRRRNREAVDGRKQDAERLMRKIKTLNNVIIDEMLCCEEEGGDVYGNQQKIIQRIAYAGNTHFRVPGEDKEIRRNNGRRTNRIAESNRQGDRGGVSFTGGEDTEGKRYSLKTSTGREENRALFDKAKKIFGTTFN